MTNIESEEEEVDKSCLTEENDDDYLSDYNSHKRRRELLRLGTRIRRRMMMSGFLVSLISKRSQLSRMMLKT